MMSLASIAMLLTASCVTADLCGALDKFEPDDGFEERWTDGEKRQAVALNRKLEKFCR